MVEANLMECGCRGMGVDSKTGKPICLTHLCETVMSSAPDLSTRSAKCMYCPVKKVSSVNLPFFVYQAENNVDRFYCGCMGWE